MKKSEKKRLVISGIILSVTIVFVFASTSGALSVFSQFFSQYQPQSSLSNFTSVTDAFWSFNDGIGNIATDSGPNSNTAVFQNSQDLNWITLTNRTAIQFGGNNGYLSTNYYGISGSNPRTFSVWILPSLTCGFPTCDILTYGSEISGQRIEFSEEGNALGLRIYGAYIVYRASLLDGNWHFVSVVIPQNANINQAKFYVDGKKLSSTFNQIGINTLINTGQTNPVNIGRLYSGANTFSGAIAQNGANYCKCTMFNLRVLNIALTDRQELGLYQSGG